MIYKLLLIEDNKVDANVFRQMLELSGMKVLELKVVDSLESGLVALQEFIPDVLFLDLTLGDSNGIATFYRIKNTVPNVPVVILTGNEDENIALLSLRDGAQDYIPKSELSPGLISRSVIYSIQRKKIEIELLKAKANQDALIENTKDGIWSIDRNMCVISFNSRFRDSMKLLADKEPEPGMTMLELLPLRYHEWFTAIFQRAINGEQFRNETLLHFSDKEHHLEFSVNPVKIEQGHISGVSFFARNINQRKLAEKRIQQSEDAYKLLLETINEGVMFIDNENKIRFANRKFTETTGFDEDELKGVDFSKLLIAEDPYHGRNIVGELLSREEPVEIHLKTKSGQIVWFQLKASPLMDENGAVAGSLLTHTEITAQKQAEQTIRKQEQDYKNLLETMNEGLIYLDPSGLLKFANQRFLIMTGLDLNETLNKRIPHSVLPETLLDLMIEEASAAKNNSEQAYQYEIQISSTNGEKKWCMINCSLIRDEARKFNGLLVTYFDITDRKLTEDKLQLAERELNTFIYKSSHDLKGPLSSILGLINLLEKEQETMNNPCVKMIRQSAGKADRMLNEMLNVVRIKREKIYPETIDFRSDISEVVQSLRTSDAFYDVRRDIVIESKKELRTDKKLLQLVMHNLMDNAIKYRDPEKKDAFVAVLIRDYMHGVRIEIEDNGCGFKESTKGNIFNMFNRGSYNADGNGLGLYVVKNAVDRLGGYIELSCTEGENTRFTMFLPDLFATEQWPEKTNSQVT
ncbi:MAG: PAS domain S-box protein [Bacteroidota bacterium]|nr:PAS domain S-box protein [Bacteroidota bacterium]